MIGAAVGRYLAIAGAVLIALVAVYLWGRQDGKTVSQIEGLNDTIEAHETRQKIDEDVRVTDRYSLCVSMRGLPEQCEQLRRMEKAAKPE